MLRNSLHFLMKLRLLVLEKQGFRKIISHFVNISAPGRGNNVKHAAYALAVGLRHGLQESV